MPHLFILPFAVQNIEELDTELQAPVAALPSDLTARQIDRMTWDARGLNPLWPLNAVGWKYGVRDYESGKRSFI